MKTIINSGVTVRMLNSTLSVGKKMKKFGFSMIYIRFITCNVNIVWI